MALARWVASRPPSSSHCSKRVVVGDLRAVEGRLEVGQGVAVAEEMEARAVLADRVEGLAVLGQVDPVDEDRGHPALVVVEDELLVADGEAALEPAGRVEDEVHAGEDRRLERGRRFVGGLRIGDLRGAQVAAGAERHAEPAGQRCHDVQDEGRLGGPEGRRARLHRDRRGEAPEHDRRTGPGQLDERHPGKRFGERLGRGRRHRHRGHRAGKDERA